MALNKYLGGISIEYRKSKSCSKGLRIDIVEMLAESKSGTPEVLLKHYGLTSEDIVKSAKNLK